MTATTRMSMNKVIHGAVRRDLDRFRRALDAFADGDRERAEALHRAWLNFDAQLTEHHEGEHEIAWPAMQAIGISEPTIASFDAEHEQMAADLATARGAMATLRRTATRADADAAGAAMRALQATTVTHLDHEENETESALTAHEGDPVLKEMGKKFSRRVGPARAGVFFTWVQDGATEEERAALAATVPRPVLAMIGGIFGRRYRKEVAPVWSR
ncbi:MAG: hemerythrin domain-containing protein [Nocardioides sp.]